MFSSYHEVSISLCSSSLNVIGKRFSLKIKKYGSTCKKSVPSLLPSFEKVCRTRAVFCAKHYPIFFTFVAVQSCGVAFSREASTPTPHSAHKGRYFSHWNGIMFPVHLFSTSSTSSAAPCMAPRDRAQEKSCTASLFALFFAIFSNVAPWFEIPSSVRGWIRLNFPLPNRTRIAVPIEPDSVSFGKPETVSRKVLGSGADDASERCRDVTNHRRRRFEEERSERETKDVGAGRNEEGGARKNTQVGDVGAKCCLLKTCWMTCPRGSS